MQATPPDRNAVYRLDRFNLPATARAEFLARVRETHDFLRRQPGFIRDLLLESPLPGDRLALVTLVEWRDSAAVQRARAAMSERHRSNGFDPREFMAQRGIEADIGNFVPAGH